MKTRMVNYLMKTSKHLFINGANEFKKVLLVKINEKSRCYVDTREVIVTHLTESL